MEDSPNNLLEKNDNFKEIKLENEINSEDEIIDSYDVVLSNFNESCDENLYLIQYPLRPKSRPYKDQVTHT